MAEKKSECALIFALFHALTAAQPLDKQNILGYSNLCLSQGRSSKFSPNASFTALLMAPCFFFSEKLNYLL